jgi:hypothetical protein
MKCRKCGEGCFGSICAYCKGEKLRPLPKPTDHPPKDAVTVTLPRSVWEDIINARGIVGGSTGARAIGRLAEELGATWDTTLWRPEGLTPEEYRKETQGEWPIDEPPGKKGRR